MKRCTKCDVDKSEDDFHRNTRRKDGLQTWCKECQRQSTYEWRRRNPERVTEIARRSYARVGAANQRRRLYGISEDDYRQMCTQQSYACLLCGDDEAALHVDHCHTTGRVRGLLCRECNVGIGKFRDDPERMRAAADYVEAARTDRQ